MRVRYSSIANTKRLARLAARQHAWRATFRRTGSPIICGPCASRRYLILDEKGYLPLDQMAYGDCAPVSMMIRGGSYRLMDKILSEAQGP
ncbi:MAG: hypothetical protein M3077_06515 [Candidatus Dormibacteraeota bacterium]|nr:hypothetical protein [Candidatus Dormibacteraeota bacterium]